MKPLAIDLYCGLGGWTEGFLSEGYTVTGFDIAPQPLYRGDIFMQQDVLTLHGSQFKDATIIVGSSPCQEFSYRAMPFKRGKSLGPPELGIKLFQAQFRIQQEASEAAGRYIPMVVENVRGAQPWVGRAAWHYGSYYLWGDVPALMPFTLRGIKCGAPPKAPNGTTRLFTNPGEWQEGDTYSDGVKLPNNGSARMWRDRELPRLNAVNKHEDGYSVAVADGTKQHGSGAEWFDKGIAKHSSHSSARKAASAQIAKIPFELARHIASVFKPIAQS